MGDRQGVGISRRAVVSGIGMLAAAPAAARPRYDAAVAKPSDAPPGVKAFPSLTAALDAAPAGEAAYTILIGRGVWDGKSVIRRPNVRLIGADRAKSVLRFVAASGHIAADGKPYGTFRTPTLAIRAAGCSLQNLTVENGFDSPAEMAKTGERLRSDSGLGPQAIALTIGKESDRTLLDHVTLLSHQDTLFVEGGRALLRDSLIAGSYDFIFGGGTAWFEACEIRSRARTEPIEGYITAPSTAIDRPYGLVFDRCRLTRDAGVPRGSVFLGRPWRPSSQFPDGRYGDPRFVGMAAYLRCWMDDHVAAAGWTEMWYTGRDGNPRTMLQPEEARFMEFASRGPGAGAHPRGRTLSAAEAARFTRDAVLEGWSI